MEQIIIHVEMDAFYASVEMRDNPDLSGKPLIIGSLPHERGVVSTCNYEARTYGIHSGMNIKDAYKFCPKGIFMHPNMDKYKLVSEQLHDIWGSYAKALEGVAFDEAYLDVTKQAKDLDGAREIAKIIKQRTKDEVGLTCSIGVAYSKTAAKIASEEEKPNGYFEIATKEDFVNLIIDRDVKTIYTVGKATANKLYSIGINTVRDIRDNKEKVINLLGKQGKWIVNVAFGIDDRKVTPWLPQDAKSIRREVTFQKDVNNYQLIKDVLFLLSLSVEYRAKKYNLYGNGVSLTITFPNMKKIIRSKKILYCDSAMSIYEESIKLLNKIRQQPIRLIGTGIYNLCGINDEEQLIIDGFFTDTQETKNEKMKKILDELQERYHLDFVGHLEQLQQANTLYKTIEYMRKHS